MQTDLVFGYAVENNDWLPANDERPDAYVYMREDEGDFISLDLVDNDGEHYTEKVAAFDTVTIITSFEDEEEEISL